MAVAIIISMFMIEIAKFFSWTADKNKVQKIKASTFDKEADSIGKSILSSETELKTVRESRSVSVMNSENKSAC